MAESLSGIIERVVFHNPENGFAVLRVQPKGRHDQVTVVGQVATANAGEYLEASGGWTNNKEHGPQFKAEELRTMPPHTTEGIEKYLASGLVKGIGPHFAHKIVEVFGERTLQVIDDSPSFLREVKGIGPQRLQRIRESWTEQKAVRSIIVFLQSHGVGTARAVRIFKTYGDQAIDIVRANPYRLASDIWGIGFQSADQIAEKLQIDRQSPLRAQAALRYVLQQLSKEGHCGFSEEGIVERTIALTDIPPEIVRAAIEHERGLGEVIREPESGPEPWLYLKLLHQAEVCVAQGLVGLRDGSHPLPIIDTDAALVWVEKKMGLELASTQRDAIRRATMSKVLVITGGPGVGKTTIVRGILEIFVAKGLRCALTAPTGRAAKRLSETTGREAKTIHRLLEFEPIMKGFKRDAIDPLPCDLLIVDEASMVDMVLMHHLVKAVPKRACLVLVGDVDQLPSVGPGTVLADIIASKVVPVVRLTEIFRQAGQSWIVRAAHQVNQGEKPESAPDSQGDFFFIEAESPEQIMERIITLVRERIPARFGLDPSRDIQVLTPMNRSELGVRNLNLRLQEILNPAGSTVGVQRFGWTFHVGDKVLQNVNDYKKEVFNGDIGRIAKIDSEEQVVTVTFDGREAVYEFGELDELSLAYALSIHKSQGSEYPAVVIPLHTQHYLMLQRNLLYTGITRGRKVVVIVGSRKALALAVKRQDTSQRFSKLCSRLQDNDRRGAPFNDSE